MNRTFLQIGDSTVSTNSTKFSGGFIARELFRTKGAVEYLNKGLGGSTYSEWNDHANRSIWKSYPSLVLIHLGMNDCIESGSTSEAGIATFQSNVTSLVTKIRSFIAGVEIVLVSPNGVGTGNTRLAAADAPNQAKTKIGLYRELIEALATSLECYYADLTDVWTDGAGGDANTLDGVHPTDAGQELIANYLIDIIETTDYYAAL